MKFNIETYEKFDTKLFVEWEHAWKKSKGAHMFNSPYWFRSFTNSYNTNKQLIIVCRVNNNLVGVLPLIKSKKYGFSAYISPGGKYLDKNTLFLGSDSKIVVKKLITKLIQIGNFYLTEIPEATNATILNNFKKLKSSVSSVSRILLFNDDPFLHVNHENIRRIRKRIKENENIKFQTSYGDIRSVIKTIKEIEGDSSKRTSNKQVFTDTNLINAYAEIQSLCKNSIIFTFIYDQDEAIGYIYGFVINNSYHYCNTAFKSKYGKISPGKMLMFLTIDELNKNKINLVDFSRGDTQFKQEFTPNTYNQYSIYYFKNPIVMFVWNTLYKIKPYLDKHENILEFIRINIDKVKKFIK